MKKFFLSFLILVGTVVGFASPAFASGGTEHLKHCVEEALTLPDVDFPGALDECHAAPEPIVPPIYEVVWTAISFTVVLVVLGKFAFPKIKKGIEDRREKITKELEDAEKAKQAGDEYQNKNKAELNSAKLEAQKIIDAAKSEANVKKNEIVKAADEEASNIKAKAESDAQKIVAQAVSDANEQIAEISLEVAEKVIGSSIDAKTNDNLVKQFVDQVSESKIKG